MSFINGDSLREDHIRYCKCLVHGELSLGDRLSHASLSDVTPLMLPEVGGPLLCRFPRDELHDAALPEPVYSEP